MHATLLTKSNSRAYLRIHAMCTCVGERDAQPHAREGHALDGVERARGPADEAYEEHAHAHARAHARTGGRSR